MKVSHTEMNELPQSAAASCQICRLLLIAIILVFWFRCVGGVLHDLID